MKKQNCKVLIDKQETRVKIFMRGESTLRNEKPDQGVREREKKG